MSSLGTAKRRRVESLSPDITPVEGVHSHEKLTLHGNHPAAFGLQSKTFECKYAMCAEKHVHTAKFQADQGGDFCTHRLCLKNKKYHLFEQIYDMDNFMYSNTDFCPLHAQHAAAQPKDSEQMNAWRDMIKQNTKDIFAKAMDDMQAREDTTRAEAESKDGNDDDSVGHEEQEEESKHDHPPGAAGGDKPDGEPSEAKHPEEAEKGTGFTFYDDLEMDIKRLADNARIAFGDFKKDVKDLASDIKNKYKQYERVIKAASLGAAVVGTSATVIVAGPLVLLSLGMKIGISAAAVAGAKAAGEEVALQCQGPPEHTPYQEPDFKHYTYEEKVQYETGDLKDGKPVKAWKVETKVEPIATRIVFHDTGRYSTSLSERLIASAIPSCCSDSIQMFNIEEDFVTSEVVPCARAHRWLPNLTKFWRVDRGDNLTLCEEDVQFRHLFQGRYKYGVKRKIFRRLYEDLVQHKTLVAATVLDQNNNEMTHFGSLVKRIAATIGATQQKLNTNIFDDTVQHARNQLVARYLKYGQGSRAPPD